MSRRRSCLVVLLKIDLPTGLELEVVNLKAGRKFAFHPNRVYLLLVRDAHGVLLASAWRGFGGSDSDVRESQGSARKRESGADDNTAQGMCESLHNIRPLSRSGYQRILSEFRRQAYYQVWLVSVWQPLDAEEI